MYKFGRGPQGDATYQISNLYAIQYQRRIILKMFQLVTPWTGPVLTPGASYEKTWYRSSKRCYILNIKALGLPVSEKKNFEIFFLCSYVPTCDLQGRPSFDPQGHHMYKLGRGPLEDTTYQTSKL